MALGDLNKAGFWELFYDYNVNNFDKYMTSCGNKMDATGCRCDRKMHVTNQSVIDSNAFAIDLIPVVFWGISMALRVGIIGASGIGYVHACHYNELGARVVAVLCSSKLKD